MYTMYVGGTVMFFAATVFMHGILGFHKLVPTTLCFMDSFQVYENKSVCRKM